MTSQSHYLSQEPELHIQELSPVSPKPLALPQPSNIPILENQMDSTMDEHSTYSVSPSQTPAEFNNVQQDGYSLEPNMAAVQQRQDERDDPLVEEPIKKTYRKLSNGLDVSNQDEIESTKEEHPLHVNGESSGTMTNGAREGEATTQGQAEASAMNPEAPVEKEHFDAMQLDQVIQQEKIAATESGPVDIQALLDTIVSNAAATHAQPSEVAASTTLQSPVLGVISSHFIPSASLPPRPPTLANGSRDVANRPFSNLVSADPHAQTFTGAPGTDYPLNALPSNISTAGAPGTALPTGSLPPPPSAVFNQLSPSLNAGNRQSPSTLDTQMHESIEQIGQIGDEDFEPRWDLDTQRKYDEFLEQERLYVMKGEWEKFPANSRLFIGNLPTEKVTKRDLFHVFHKYGPLAQVSIKQAYGFVQFLIAQDCLRALDVQQGVAIRGRKIHLEISKPQRNNNRNQTGRDKRQRRSRSPENRPGSGIDRYRGGANRRQRSPSPRSRNNNGRRRSRSRSPQYGSSRRTSRSDMEDDCPLPRRASHEVPDIQIIAKDDPDRNFLSYVQKTFEGRGLKANVLILSPKLPETSVMRRQIVEGVLAVAKVDRNVQFTHKYQLSVFDRSQGANNVKFEEYEKLDLNVCVELVVRAKQTARPPAPQYGNTNPGPYGLPMAQPQQRPPFSPSMPQPPQQYYGQPPTLQHQQRPPQPPGFDPNAIQGLINRVQQQTPQQQSQPAYRPPQAGLGQPTDFSRLLASVSGQQSYSGQPSSLPPNLQALLGNTQHHQQQSPQPYQQYQSPAPQQQQQQQQAHQYQAQPQPQPPDFKNIMANLAKYRG